MRIGIIDFQTYWETLISNKFWQDEKLGPFTTFTADPTLAISEY